MLELAASGLGYSAIAAQMGISRATVSNRLRELNTGLGPDFQGMKAIAHGSARLRTAVVAAGGHR